MEELNICEEKEPMVSYYWKGLALFLLGILLGIILSPVKNGVIIGKGNIVTNNDGNSCDDCDDDVKF
jgi:hypothetical protein